MSNSAIQIKTERPRIEELLAPYRDVIGDDYSGYRNHVFRTVTYAMHFLDGDLDVEPTVETAMAYHDIGSGQIASWRISNRPRPLSLLTMTSMAGALILIRCEGSSTGITRSSAIEDLTSGS